MHLGSSKIRQTELTGNWENPVQTVDEPVMTPSRLPKPEHHRTSATEQGWYFFLERHGDSLTVQLFSGMCNIFLEVWKVNFLSKGQRLPRFSPPFPLPCRDHHCFTWFDLLTSALLWGQYLDFVPALAAVTVCATRHTLEPWTTGRQRTGQAAAKGILVLCKRWAPSEGLCKKQESARLPTYKLDTSWEGPEDCLLSLQAVDGLKC